MEWIFVIARAFDWMRVNGFGSFALLGALFGHICYPADTFAQFFNRAIIGFFLSVALTPLLSPLVAGLIEISVNESAAKPWREYPAPLGILIGMMGYWIVSAIVSIARNTHRRAEEEDIDLFDFIETKQEPTIDWDVNCDDDKNTGKW